MLENRRKNKYLLITKIESVETEFKNIIQPNMIANTERKQTNKMRIYQPQKKDTNRIIYVEKPKTQYEANSNKIIKKSWIK